MPKVKDMICPESLQQTRAEKAAPLTPGPLQGRGGMQHIRAKRRAFFVTGGLKLKHGKGNLRVLGLWPPRPMAIDQRFESFSDDKKKFVSPVAQVRVSKSLQEIEGLLEDISENIKLIDRIVDKDFTALPPRLVRKLMRSVCQLDQLKWSLLLAQI